MDRRFSREIARLEVGGPFRKRNVGGEVALANLVGGGAPRGSEKKSPDLKSAEVGISVF